MPAELGLDRVGYAAGLERGDGFEEGFDHVAFAEPAQIAAGGGGGTGGVLAGERGEIAAVLEFGHERLRFFLGFDEDVRGAVLHFAGFLGVLLFIGGLKLGFVDAAFHHLGDDLSGGDGAFLVLQQDLALKGQVALEGLLQQGLLHELVDDALEQQFGRELIILPRQIGADGDDVAEGDLGAVDGGHDLVRIGGFLCLCKGACHHRRGEGGGEDRAKGCGHGLSFSGRDQGAAPCYVDTRSAAPYIAL